MKKSNIIITIPKPCSENWSEMTAVEQGRFCKLCQKKVYDFTQSSDREIAKAFQSNGSLCGRFADTQLNRELILPKEKSTIWMATTSAIISFLGLGGEELVAQEKPNIEQTEKLILKGKPAIEPKNNDLYTVSGTVSDETGPLPGANVVIKNTKHSVLTDLDGKYVIRVKKNDILVFSLIGLKDKSVKVKSATKNLDVKLDSYPVMGVVIIQDKEE